MVHSPQKIIEALEVIQDVCNDCLCDASCPFFDDERQHCLMMNEEGISPNTWHLNYSVNWKAVI